MTNKEWLFSLSDEQLADILINDAKVICDEIEPCDFVAGIGDKPCNKCIERWLNEEHKNETKHFITNRAGEKVKVPNVGDTVFLVHVDDLGTTVVTQSQWKNTKRFLNLLYNQDLCTTFDEATVYVTRYESFMDKLCEEADLGDIPY